MIATRLNRSSVGSSGNTCTEFIEVSVNVFLLLFEPLKNKSNLKSQTVMSIS
jgi:hypothetical protein